MHPISTQTAEHYTWGQVCDGWHLVKGHEFSVIQERMPGQSSEVAHYHARSRQFFFVLSGTLSIDLGGQVHTLRPQHGLEIAPTIVHRVFNESSDDVTFLVISAPPSHGDRIEVS